ncbi:hypothetical protein D3C72_1968420 [compost metagenome]
MQLRFAFESLRGLTDQRGRPGMQTATMGDADVADHLFASKLHVRLRAHALAANDV